LDGEQWFDEERRSEFACTANAASFNRLYARTLRNLFVPERARQQARSIAILAGIQLPIAAHDSEARARGGPDNRSQRTNEPTNHEPNLAEPLSRRRDSCRTTPSGDDQEQRRKATTEKSTMLVEMIALVLVTDAIIDCVHQQRSLIAVIYVLRLFTEYATVDHGC